MAPKEALYAMVRERCDKSLIKLGQAHLHNIPHQIHLIPQIARSPHDVGVH